MYQSYDLIAAYILSFTRAKDQDKKMLSTADQDEVVFFNPA